MSRNRVRESGFILAFVFFAVLSAVSRADSGDYAYDDQQKRDPFISLVTDDGRYVQLERSKKEQEESELKIEGIIFDKYSLSYAIVNGSVVKVGDNISDYQVLRIEEKKVVFIREGQIKEVLLQKED